LKIQRAPLNKTSKSQPPILKSNEKKVPQSTQRRLLTQSLSSRHKFPNTRKCANLKPTLTKTLSIMFVTSVRFSSHPSEDLPYINPVSMSQSSTSAALVQSYAPLKTDFGSICKCMSLLCMSVASARNSSNLSIITRPTADRLISPNISSIVVCSAANSLTTCINW